MTTISLHVCVSATKPVGQTCFKRALVLQDRALKRMWTKKIWQLQP